MRFLHVDHKEVQDIEHFERHIQSCEHIRHWYLLETEIKHKYQNIKTNVLLLNEEES